MKDLLPHKGKGSLLKRRNPSVFDLMESFWNQPLTNFDRFAFETDEFPSIDVSENEKEIKVTAELPGLEPKDIDVSVAQGCLTIKGEKKFEDEEKKENYHRRECSYGCFQRSVTLPANIDESKIDATYKNGKRQPAQNQNQIITFQQSETASPFFQ